MVKDPPEHHNHGRFLFFILLSVQLCIRQVGTQSLLARKTASMEISLTCDGLDTRLRCLKNRKQAWKLNSKSIWRLHPSTCISTKLSLRMSCCSWQAYNSQRKYLRFRFTASISTRINAIMKDWISFLILVRLKDFLFTIIFSFI